MLTEPKSNRKPRGSRPSTNGAKQGAKGGKKSSGDSRNRSSESRSGGGASSGNSAAGRGRTKVSKPNRSADGNEPFVFGVTQSKPKKKKKNRPGKKERLQAKESNPA